MKTIYLLNYTLFFTFFFNHICSVSYAQINSQATNSQTTIVNQVLFSEGDQSWTSRDLKLYKKLVLGITGKDKIIHDAENLLEDFVWSRVLKREALLFEIKPQEVTASTTLKKDLSEFSKAEISDELTTISYVNSLLELKKNQMSQKIRFQAWMDVLKRKYAVKIKANEN